ncbi:MAG TPA: FtsX-like permease family protein [Bacillota bacterium]|nr:FtsX-like permease family protein [Bacillota bacterium]
MNIVNRLTWRHMMKNKRRTLVTMIGIIISVAMITAVTTLATSFLNFAKSEHIANEGEWHITYKDVDHDQLQAIENDELTDKIIISRELGYAPLEDSKNPAKPYMYIKQYNDIGFKQMPIDLMAGRLPENGNELLVSEHMLTNGQVDLAIDDQLTVDIGERITSDQDLSDVHLGQTSGLLFDDDEMLEDIETTTSTDYTIVGIMQRPAWEPIMAPGFTALSYVSETNVSASDPADLSVVWNNVKRETLNQAIDLGKTLQINDVEPNNNLLRYYGITDHEFLLGAIYSVSAIIMTVIIIGSISLIYNAFAISVSERSRYLGMLSSVGATKQQKRNSILFEGVVIGIISIPIGIISGIGGIAITLYLINPTLQNLGDFKTDLAVSVTPLAVIIAIIIATLTIFISAYIPALRASKISAIDAIRQSKDIKLTRKKVKTSKLTRKIFGIEAEIALKNLKRHKRRYYATVFSLVISIILFLTVSFLTDQMRVTSNIAISDENYDLTVDQSFDDGGFNDELKQSIELMDEVTQLSQLTYVFVETYLTEEQIHQSIKDEVIDGEALVYVALSIVDEKTLQTYADEVGISYDTLVDQDQLSGIVINQATNHGEKYGKITPVNMEPGDQLKFFYYDWQIDKDVEIDQIEIAALTDQRPHGVSLPTDARNLKVVISEEVFHELNETYDMQPHSKYVISSSDPMKTHEQLEKIVDPHMYIYNPSKIHQEEEGLILIISVFTYGFITLITLISVANIFNTISTSISLRTRELGMMKSIGMTPKGFNRMINYESLFYGIKALLFGLPISFGIMFIIYRELAGAFEYPFEWPWGSIISVIVAVFVIVGLAMLYSSAKVKKANIIDALKSENN